VAGPADAAVPEALAGVSGAAVPEAVRVALADAGPSPLPRNSL
jgi:hypothetical protein